MAPLKIFYPMETLSLISPPAPHVREELQKFLIPKELRTTKAYLYVYYLYFLYLIYEN
ncbi:hypothetical protein UT300006_04430 [Clostridium sp. CTA-6]